MSSSSSTTPASRPAGEAPPDGPKASARRTVITWVLFGIWGVLVAFGILSLFSPTWLEDLGQRGRSTEAFVGQHFGDLAFRSGDYARAIAEYRRALEIDPDNAGIYLNLGIAYLECRQPWPAREALQKAEECATTPRMHSRIALYRGDLERLQGRTEEALHYYAAALGPETRPDLVYRKIGALHLEQENYELARQSFEQCLAAQLDPQLPYREMLNRARDAAATDAELQAWLETWGSQELTAAHWAKLDQETVDLMHQSDPEIAKTHNHLGLICYRLDRIDDAIGHFEASLAIWPGNRDAVTNLRILKNLSAPAAGTTN